MHQSVPLNVPTIRSDQIVLRAFAESDVDAVIDASSDPFIPKITSVPERADVTSALAFIARQHERAVSGAGYSFAVEVDSMCVGQIGLWLRDVDQGRATIGYWIRPASRRRGFAAAALAVVTKWGFETVGVDRLQLYVEPWNVGSWRAAERVGYKREGLLQSWERVGEERRDMFMYGLAPRT